MARIPESIGKYKVESLIAKGGMGAVYKAIHPTLNRPVIIKKLTLRGRKDITERFKREARILMDFRHDGIVNMYDHFNIGSSYYIVLEFIDGAALDEIIKKQRYLDNGTAAYILYHTALALHYAHGKKVVHRDIKPANLLLSKNGDIKLVDFGIAVSDEDSDTGLTREGMSLGTPGYMAPEQFNNTKNVDQKADIYSLGVMVYEMLTGKKPFPGAFTPELVSNIQKGKYTNPRKYNPGIHPVLLKFIKKAMNPKPERRYKDLVPVIKMLERFLKHWSTEGLSHVVSQLAEGKDPEKPKPNKKVKVVLTAALSALAVLTIAFGALFCYFTGAHNFLFHPKNYKPVFFSVRVPGGVQPANRIFIKTDIFRDDNRKIPEVENRKIIFRKSKSSGNGGAYLFHSLPVYLQSGAYRAKIEIEDTLNWYSFVVNSDRVTISINKTDIPPSKVRVSVQIADILDGKSITKGNSIFISRNGKWERFENNELIESGTVSRFRIENPLYYTKIFALRIKEGQDTLNIEAGLVPLPGTLVLNRDKNDIIFRINGRDTILSVEEVPTSLDLNKKTSFRGKLAPGTYSLEARYKSKKVTMPLTITVNKILTVFVFRDSGTNELEYTVK